MSPKPSQPLGIPRVFVDTGAWAAVQIADDEHHAAAVRTLKALMTLPAILVTTNHVVGETYTLLRVTCGYPATARFLEAIEATERLQREFVSEALERRALTVLARYREHAFSFVDATSFAVMHVQRIRYAFAFDSHFATAGFLRVALDVGVQELAGAPR